VAAAWAVAVVEGVGRGAQGKVLVAVTTVTSFRWQISLKCLGEAAKGALAVVLAVAVVLAAGKVATAATMASRMEGAAAVVEAV